MLLAQREAEAARQEALEARSFEVELRSAAERNTGKMTQDRDELRRRAEHAEEQLTMATEHNDQLQAQLRAAEGKVGELATDTSKWKETWHDMESDLQAARQEVRMLKRSQHDKTLGLETVLTKKEGALEQALHDKEQLERKCLNAEAEVERMTDSLSEALSREENLRKHSEAIGQVFQVRLLELQGKYTAAHDSEAQLEKELKQVRAQRDQEVAAAAAMFKNVEQRAVQQRQDHGALQNALDFSARLEKDVAQLQEQLATANIQQISHKSRWAFASFRAEHLARRVTELEGSNKTLASQLRGAQDAADRALLHTGSGTTPTAGGPGGADLDLQGQLAEKRMEQRELQTQLSNQHAQLLQERERANNLQRLLDRESQLRPGSSSGATVPGGSAAPVGAAITLGQDGGGDIGDGDDDNGGGLTQQLKKFRARALQAEASVRELQARLDRGQDNGGAEHRELAGNEGHPQQAQEFQEFRARALRAEASLRELQPQLQQAVADKSIRENKLMSLGYNLEALKANLAEQATLPQPAYPSAQQAVHETTGVNDMLRAQLQAQQQELDALRRKHAPAQLPEGSHAELQVELASVRQQVSELQLMNDDLTHQLHLSQQLARDAEDQLARAKEDFEIGRQRLEKEVVALRQVADDRQRRLKERDTVLRLSATGPAAAATAGSAGLQGRASAMRPASFVGSSSGGSPSRLRSQPLQDFADGYDPHKRSRTPLQDYEDARKSGASVTWAQARAAASPRAGGAGGARGSLNGSLLQPGLVESDESSVTDLDAASLRSQVSAYASQSSYDREHVVAGVGGGDVDSLNSFEGHHNDHASEDEDRVHYEDDHRHYPRDTHWNGRKVPDSQRSTSDRSEAMSQSSAASAEILGLDQFLELLRLKNVMPYMVSRQEAENAFYESVNRRGKAHMVFDDFKGCIRDILASKDMLTQSGNFQINIPDSEEERRSLEQQEAMIAQRDARNRQEQRQYLRDSTRQADR